MHSRTASARSTDTPWVQRPLGLTLVAWYLIVYGAYDVFRAMFFEQPVEGFEARHYVLSTIQFLLYLGSGVGMLLGREWARLLWVGTCGALLMVIAARQPFPAGLFLGRILLLGIWIRILFRPAVNDYFATMASLRDPALKEWPFGSDRR